MMAVVSVSRRKVSLIGIGIGWHASVCQRVQYNYCCFDSLKEELTALSTKSLKKNTFFGTKQSQVLYLNAHPKKKSFLSHGKDIRILSPAPVGQIFH